MSPFNKAEKRSNEKYLVRLHTTKQNFNIITKEDSLIDGDKRDGEFYIGNGYRRRNNDEDTVQNLENVTGIEA